jgi:hypothetical protein
MILVGLGGLIGGIIFIGWYNGNADSRIVGNPLSTALENAPYKKDRGLVKYVRFFGPQLVHEIIAAGPTAHIADFGAGEGNFDLQLIGLAALDDDSQSRRVYRRDSLGGLIESSRELRMTAITYETDIVGNLRALGIKAADVQKRLHIFQGRLFNQVPNQEILKDFGQVDVGLDLWGVLAYTDTPTEDLAKIHELLKVGAPYFLVESSFLFNQNGTVVHTQSNETIPFAKYLLRNLRGFEIQTIFSQSERTASDYLLLRKNGEPFAFPKLKFEGWHTKDAIPKFRSFTELG